MAVVILFFWKLPYGWGGYDEALYISLPYRFILSNDAFVADEWNLAQFSSFILILPVKLFSMIRPDMEGVMLFFRMLYSFMHILVSFIILLILRKEGPAGVFAALIYLLFVPFNIMNFSYDAVGLSCITLCSLLIFSKVRQDWLSLITVGFLFALAVLCNPFLIVIFAVYFLTVLIMCAKKQKIGILNPGDFIYIILGIAILAVPVIAFMLKRTDIFAIIQNLPELFNDPTHGNAGIPGKIAETLIELKKFFFPWPLVWMVLTVIMLVDKNMKKRKEVYLIISTLIFVLGIACFVFNVRVNCFMLPFSFLGLNIYILSEKKNRRVLALWFSGVIYGIFMWMASDQKMYIISMTAVISDMASVFFIRDFVRDDKKNTLKAVLAVALMAQLGIQAIGFSRATHWESERVEELNIVYDRGPLKGLRTTKEKVDDYKQRIEDISRFRNGKEGRIAFMTLSTWEYLYVGRPYGSFSPWLGYTDDFIADKFIEWCRLHPDKIPEEIYFPKMGAENWEKENIKKISDVFECDMEEIDRGIILKPTGTGEKR